MDQIQEFVFEGNGVRTTLIEGEPWFVAKDVATILQYADTDYAIRTHCKKAQIIKAGETSGLEIPNRGMFVIPESDIYRLIMRSKLPQAEKFETWVMEVVLPSLRKHGGYIAGQENMSREQFLAKAVLMSDSIIKEQQALIEKQNQTIAIDAPKAEAFDVLMASDKNVCITIAAQHFGLKPKLEVFPYLRDKGYLKGKDLPTQIALDEGLLVKKVITNTATNEIIGEQARVGLDQYEAWRTKLVPKIKAHFNYK
jgi:prophage antirepressor-like protein